MARTRRPLLILVIACGALVLAPALAVLVLYVQSPGPASIDLIHVPLLCGLAVAVGGSAIAWALAALGRPPGPSPAERREARRAGLHLVRTGR
jgi:cation transporter-like permease